MKFGLRDEIYNKVKEIAGKYKHEFFIFGSRARMDYKNNSDIDIAILGDVSDEDKLKIRDEFYKIDMEYMIDIVFINEINNEELIKNIYKEGVRI